MTVVDVLELGVPASIDILRHNLDEVFHQARQALRPPRRRKLSEWADEFFFLSAESSAEPGRWHTLPYQREPMDVLTDPLVEQVVFMKSARVGFTKILNALAGYHIHQDPCAVMIVQPTIEDAEGYSKEEIAPMVRDCPVLNDLVGEARSKDSDNTILHKLFPGGSLSMVGANSARGFRRTSRRIVGCDEIDAYPQSAGAEGDPIKLAIRRTEYFHNRKLVYGSTPTVAGRSRIERLFEQGDQRRYYVPCPHCDAMQVLKFANMKWPRGNPAAAVYLCEACGAEIEYRHQRDMVNAGQWRPHAPFTGIASFHIWAAYSFSPNATWGQLCTEFVAVEHKPEELRTFVNTVLGETWQERGDAPEWQRLYQRRESYAIGACPLGVLFLTAGVDVQKDRLVYEVVGWGRGKENWSIDAGIIPGDISKPETGARLDALIGRQYLSESGVQLPIAVAAIDSGYNTQAVYAYARRHPMPKVIAIKGVDTATVLIGAPRPVDVLVYGRWAKRGYKVWPVAGKVAKSELYAWLRIDPLTDEAREAGATLSPGFCHFPEYGEDYFKQLTAEQLVPRKRRNGFVSYEWEQLPNRENHYLDCRVYARAAAAVAGLDRLSEAEWFELERVAGQEQMALPLVDGASGAEARVDLSTSPNRSEASPPTAANDSWIPRRNGWLRK